MNQHHSNSPEGMLDIDYENYLSKHDIIYTKPVSEPEEGMILGNGRVGAMLWGSGELTLQLTNVDASPQTQLSSGRINLYTGLEADADFEQRLVLYDGIIRISYGNKAVITIFGDPQSEMLGIHFKNFAGVLKEIRLKLSIWNTEELANKPLPWEPEGPDYNMYLKDVDAWKPVETLLEDDCISLSRGGENPGCFGYTLAVTADGADFITERSGKNELGLRIAASEDFTVWVANTSRINSVDNNSFKSAENLIKQARKSGYEEVLNRCRDWWHSFWEKSFVKYSNSSGKADELESLYYVSTYLIACGCRGKYPMHFINGVGRCDPDSTRWSCAYWHYNTKALYSSFLSSNHIELMDSYFRLYNGNMDKIIAFTGEEFGIDGAMVPETMTWDGDARFSKSEYVKHIFSTGAEIAGNMYLKYKYTNDTAFLRDTAYPFMREVAKFYINYLKWDGESYYIYPSNSKENYWDVLNSLPDLASIRALFPMIIEGSELLKIDEKLVPLLKRILDRLAPFPVINENGKQKYLPCNPPVPECKNMENPECDLIWPHGLTGIGYDDYEIAVNTWCERIHNDSCINIWSHDAVQAARLGLGDAAFDYMKKMVKRNKSRMSGVCDDGNGRYETNGLHMTAINESLFQSYNDILRVFPAVPSDPSFKGAFLLLAKGGFLVSSEFSEGCTKYVRIKSLYGNSCTVANPWGKNPVCLTDLKRITKKIVEEQDVFEFDTSADGIYLIERMAES